VSKYGPGGQVGSVRGVCLVQAEVVQTQVTRLTDYAASSHIHVSAVGRPGVLHFTEHGRKSLVQLHHLAERQLVERQTETTNVQTYKQATSVQSKQVKKPHHCPFVHIESPITT